MGLGNLMVKLGTHISHMYTVCFFFFFLEVITPNNLLQKCFCEVNFGSRPSYFRKDHICDEIICYRSLEYTLTQKVLFTK